MKLPGQIIMEHFFLPIIPNLQRSVLLILIYLINKKYEAYVIFLVILFGFTVWVRSQTITSVTIIYGGFNYFPPADILPSMFDRGEVHGLDTITTTDSSLIYRLKHAIEHLPKDSNKGRIDTRGKVSFSFDKGENWVAYFDMFYLLQRYGEKTFSLTREIRLAMNAIAARNKKRPVFDKRFMNVKY